jgi:hypothetical protein
MQEEGHVMKEVYDKLVQPLLVTVDQKLDWFA